MLEELVILALYPGFSRRNLSLRIDRFTFETGWFGLSRALEI